MNLYVSNLSFSVQDSDLRNLFEAHGEVSSAKVITDRETGRSRGFGFVEMTDKNAAETAMNALNGSMVDGRQLKITEARPKESNQGNRGGRW